MRYTWLSDELTVAFETTKGSLGHSDKVDVVDSDMEERSRAKSDDRRANIRVGDDLNTEYICDAPSGLLVIISKSDPLEVWSEQTRDQDLESAAVLEVRTHLSLLIEYEKSLMISI